MNSFPLFLFCAIGAFAVTGREMTRTIDLNIDPVPENTASCRRCLCQFRHCPAISQELQCLRGGPLCCCCARTLTTCVNMGAWAAIDMVDVENERLSDLEVGLENIGPLE